MPDQGIVGHDMDFDSKSKRNHWRIFRRVTTIFIFLGNYPGRYMKSEWMEEREIEARRYVRRLQK